MDSIVTINTAEHPVLGIGTHITITVEQNDTIIAEANGFARVDGKINLSALYGDLAALITPGSYLDHSKDYNKQVVFSGTMQQVQDRLDIMLSVAKEIDSLGLKYSVLTLNSNSVANTLLAAIGISTQKTKGFAPAINKILLDIDYLEDIANTLIYNDKCFLAGTEISMWPLDVKPMRTESTTRRRFGRKSGKNRLKKSRPKTWLIPMTIMAC